MLKIRRSRDRVIFTMGIPIPGKTVSILRRGPDPLSKYVLKWSIDPKEEIHSCGKYRCHLLRSSMIIS